MNARAALRTFGATVFEAAPAIPLPAKPVCDRQGVCLEHLAAPGCKWPITPDLALEHRFCASPRLAGSPYCEEHDDLAYNEPTHKVLRPHRDWDRNIVSKK